MTRETPADTAQARLQATKEEEEENGVLKTICYQLRTVWYIYLRIPESDWLEKWGFSFIPLKFRSCEIKKLCHGPNIVLRREAVEEDCLSLKLKAPRLEIFAQKYSIVSQRL